MEPGKGPTTDSCPLLVPCYFGESVATDNLLCFVGIHAGLAEPGSSESSAHFFVFLVSGVLGRKALHKHSVKGF